MERSRWEAKGRLPCSKGQGRTALWRPDSPGGAVQRAGSPAPGEAGAFGFGSIFWAVPSRHLLFLFGLYIVVFFFSRSGRVSEFSPTS